MSARFERPPTAQAAVLDELRRRIIHGELAPGQPIRQERLAAELGVSRLPVREAFMVLEAEQLVTYSQHKGYVLRPLDAVDLVQTYRLRGLLESDAIHTAVPNLQTRDVDEMRATAAKMREVDPSDNVQMISLNRHFHFTLFAAARNGRLLGMLRHLWDACDRYRALYYSEPAARDRVHHEHFAIVDACAERNAAECEKLNSEHRTAGLAKTLWVIEMQAGNEAAQPEQQLSVAGPATTAARSR